MTEITSEITPKPQDEIEGTSISSATLTGVPNVGKVNAIELRQEDRTDYLFTRLEEEEALRYRMGDVKTRYAPTKGNVCLIVTKYRGDAFDANMPQSIGECYTLLFCPQYAYNNADLTGIAEEIDDADIKKALMSLDESKALKYKNKYLVERELRLKGEAYTKQRDMSIREAATDMTATYMDDIALADGAVQRQQDTFDMNSVSKWISGHLMWVVLLFAIILIVASMFVGG